MLEKTLESPLDCKEIQTVHPEGDQSWVFIGRTDVEAETPILWPRDAKSWIIGKDWCWEILKAGGEVYNREWDGWIASPNQWTWFWVNSRRWWWTGRPGMLRPMGSQRVGHNGANELNIPLCLYISQLFYPFIGQWTSRLLPWLSFCKQCLNEHWGTCVFWILVFSEYIPRSGIVGLYGSLLSNLQEAVLRWWRNRTGRPPSPPQIHWTNIWTLSKFYKTTSEW